VWNLDKVHKVGELLAAVAVVISLLFVGYEIRQNNETQKRLTTRSLARDWSYAVESLQDPDMACLYIRKWGSSADLTAQETMQINMLLWRVYKVHEEIQYQYLEGEVDESVWIGFRNATIAGARNQAFRGWWEDFRWSFGDRFKAYMDDLIATEPLVEIAGVLNIDCDAPANGGRE
jgi:hypothetical protein